MVKVLQDLWIMAEESGIVLYHRVFDEKVDAQLFGGLMSALNSFAEVLSEQGLSSFELSEKRFAILKKGKILFIGNSSRKVKEKRLVDELEIIAKKFYDLYGMILETWDGDIALFSNFEIEIEDSLEGTIDKFKKAFW